MTIPPPPPTPSPLTQYPVATSGFSTDLYYVVQSGTSKQIQAANMVVGGNVPSGVTPGTYGSASQVGQFAVNAQGVLTSASNVAIAIAASQVTSGQLALARGGTGANLSGTGGTGQVVKQTTVGGAFTVAAIAASELPTTLTGITFTGGTFNSAAFNGTLGATTPNTAVVTTLTSSGQTSLGGFAGSESFRAVVVASQVNRVEARGGAAGVNTTVGFNAAGSDSDIWMNYYSKGINGHRFWTNGTTGVEQVRINHQDSANRYLALSGANNGNPTIDVSGGALRLASTNILLGADIATLASIAGTTPRVQTHGTNGNGASGGIFNWAASSNGGNLFLAKSRSGAVGTQTIVQSGDILGLMDFAGSDGTAFIAGARITARVDGTPGTNDMPTRFEFSTTQDGASSPTLALSILSDQTIRFESASFAANGAVATVLTSLGPTGSHTTVQEWLQVRNASGTVRYIPCF